MGGPVGRDEKRRRYQDRLEALSAEIEKQREYQKELQLARREADTARAVLRALKAFIKNLETVGRGEEAT